MSSENPIRLTVGGAEYIAPIAKLLSAAFLNDQIGRYIYLCENDLPNETVISQERSEKSFVDRLTRRIVTGPELVEAGDWAAAAVWFPPGAKLPPPDRATAAEILVEFYDKCSAVKKKYMGDQNYWYLNLLGRDPSRNEPGVVTALISTYLKKAREAGVPAWLEASGTHSRDIYAHLGFRFVEEVKLAVGKADKDGFRVEGGEGISLYAMIAEPES